MERHCESVAIDGADQASVKENVSQDECALLDIPLDVMWEIFADLDAVSVKVLQRVCWYFHAMLAVRPTRQHTTAILDIDQTGSLMPPRRLARHFPAYERDLLRICVRMCLPPKINTLIIRRGLDRLDPKNSEWSDMYEYSNDLQALMTAVALTRQSVLSSFRKEPWPIKTIVNPLSTLIFSNVTISQNLFAADQQSYSAPWVQLVRLHRVGLRARLPFQELEWVTFDFFIDDALIPVAVGPGLRFGRESDWAWARFVAETAGQLTPEEKEQVGEWLQREEEPEVKELMRHLAWMRNYGIFEDEGLPEGGYKSRPLTVFHQATLWLQRFVFAFFSCYGCFSEYAAQHR